MRTGDGLTIMLIRVFTDMSCIVCLFLLELEANNYLLITISSVLFSSAFLYIFVSLLLLSNRT